MSKQDEDFNIDKNLEQNSFKESQQEEQNYIEEMIENQNNQFNPGYYVGTGKIPPAIKASGNAMPLAIWMFIQAAGLIIFYCFLIKFLFLSNTPYFVVSFVDGSPLFNFIVITVVFLVATSVCIWFGIVYLKKAKLYRFKKKQLEKLDSSDNIKGGNQIAQRTCPECGKKHDIDYPKCPYCKHSYTTK
ncbi:hypothetical protein EQM14_09250 [Caproiciproducens sp. NJN-50]|uniref:hypothetical protein n=1 Tax=Acutalibacteraceae TaxID=3082771 RepID=UPI000FFE0E8E|nr:MULTISPECIES: hypothetical protein [Acutalibacteraceae]QAT49944.1 hypothetical protein EQM14_09250 [Caproiciproducens sp. NJN-50]